MLFRSDHLLWSCNLNFVRGEDSIVRALWAGRPFVWQLYPQDDAAEVGKLEAFLQWLQPPGSLRDFFRGWNGTVHDALPPIELQAWRDTRDRQDATRTQTKNKTQEGEAT